jgi:ligand-binding sensor domain-containing protein
MMLVSFGKIHSQSPQFVNYVNGDRAIDIKSSDQNIWVGYIGGVTKINTNNNEKTFYTVQNSDLPDQWVKCLEIDNLNNIWIGTSDGLCKLKDDNWTIYNSTNSNLPGNRTDAISSDNEGNTWIACYEYSKGNNYLSMFNGTSWENYSEENSILPSNGARNIACENSGITWITTSVGVIKIDGENWTIFNTTNSNLPSNNVTGIAIDDENNKWILSGGSLVSFDNISFNSYGEMGGEELLFDINGVLWSYGYSYGGNPNNTGDGFFSFDGQNIINYNMENSNLPSDNVLSFCIDNNNRKWCGINKLGLYKNDNDDWIYNTCSNSLIPSSSIISITKDNEGKMWLGGGSAADYLIPGIAIYDNSNWSLTRFLNYDLGEINEILIDDQGNTWICATYIGLIKYIDSENWIVYDETNSVLNSNRINCGDQGSNGILWIGLEPDNSSTGGGLLKIDQDNWSMLTTENSGLTSNVVNDIHVDSENNLWLIVGTYENQELLFYNGNTWSSYNHTNSNLPQNLMYKTVTNENNDVWLTSHYGLYNFDGNSWSLFNNTNSILPYEFCNAITIAEDQAIWVGSGDYLIKIKNDDWSKVKINKSPDYVDNYYITDIEIDDDNRVWAGTDLAGVVVYDENGSSSVEGHTNLYKQTLKISPNPSFNSADIVFEMKENTPAVISVFNIAGENVYTETFDNVKQGKNSINLDVSNLTNGTYLLTISTENTQMSGKLMVQRK